MTEIPKPSITEVLEHYGAQVLGADRGGWQKASCPLLTHDDKSPSASINESECRWHCWTCDESGDAVDLVAQNERLEFKEALEFTRKTFGSGDVDTNNRSSLNPAPRSRGTRNWTPPWARL